MDRDAIERRDFPIGRRGYDQAAVDAHLRAVADEIEELRANPGAARSAPAPLSAGTSEQVRAILEAAETGAAELRAQAGRDAGEHVARVEDATGSMLARLDELEGELKTLLDALRRSGERLNEGLAQLQREVGEFGGEDAPAPPPAPPEEPEIPEATAPASNGGGEDEAGARLIALNMALSGTPREETAAYLAEHYQLADPDALLDDVYSRADQ
ncbi:MAG TPA: DivIVA domain-containing protein [Solirubrobacteraceae bacterium]|nr:DivIVA domain-containing protein [Solirubrobacteraceae bacterium]